MSFTVLIPIADGSEEMEAVIMIDVLRRAGAAVTVASVNQLQVTASRQTKLVADCLMDQCVGKTYDLILLPGGMPGAQHLSDCEPLIQLLKEQKQQGRFLGAICAAPMVVLAKHGLLEGTKATGHPNFVDGLPIKDDVEERVVVDGTIATSRGPGTAMEFALRWVELLYGPEKARQVAEPMLPPAIIS